MSSIASIDPRQPALQQEWAAPMTPREWDEQFPGILDALPVMAGGANLVMQLASAGVGYGVMESRVESGALFSHPIKRARTTFSYIAVALLGTSEEKLAYRKAVNRAHREVYSTDKSPVQYRAFDANLQLWVAACLFWGLVDTMEKFRGELPPEQGEALLKATQPLATTLQVRPEMWPRDLAAFKVYWEEQVNQLHIDGKVRQFLLDIIDLKFLHPGLGKIVGPFHRFLTAGFLPPQMRREMHLPWDGSRQVAFDSLLKVVGAVNGLVPRTLRQAPMHVMMWDLRRRMRKGLPLV